MKILSIASKSEILYGIGFLAIGLILGWFLFSGKGNETSNINELEVHDHEQETLWTCSMHPQIRADQSGNCPICGLELVPVTSNADEEDGPLTVFLSEAAMRIAEVETSIVERKAPSKEVYLPGKVVPDERKITQLTAHFPGRIEVLYVNYTGQRVKKGQVLAKIYSPELVTAQKELFEAIRLKASNPNFYAAARNKLKLWMLTHDQIDQIESSGEVQFYYDILSPIAGTVTKRNVDNGDHVMEGMSIVEIIDLRHVWVMFDAYETDIPWVKLGDRIHFSIKSIPGRKFTSTVTFVDPVIDPKTRVAYVRTELNNPGEILKPEMFASGILNTMLPGMKEEIVVPRSSILWTGKKAVVYVKNSSSSRNMFSYRKITLGANAGEYYVVTEGLQEGEEVATNGVFKIDAASQLLGKPSMMNPEGGKQSMGMAGMDMGGDESKSSSEEHTYQGNGGKDQSSVMDMSVADKFIDQLTAVYENYLDMKNSFVASDPAEVNRTSTRVSDRLDKVDMGLLKGEMHNMWMEQLKALKQNLEIIQTENDIKKQRLAFADFNDIFYNSIKHFGLKDKTVYYQFCPMARDTTGGYWLSEINEIKNPFLGKAMRSCGETKEVLK